MATATYPIKRKQAKYQGVLYDLKTCSHCGRWGIMGKHFHRSRQTKDGYQAWCYICMRQHSRKNGLGYGSVNN